MFNTDRKRRERLRLKREQSPQTPPQTESPQRTPLASSTQVNADDRHVRAAPGRSARKRRRKLRKEARNVTSSVSIDETEPSNWLSHALAERLNLKPRNLREKRQLRQQEARRDLKKPDARVRPMGVVWISWRWLSGSLSLFLAVVLYAMLGSQAFTVNTIAVGGERYVSPEWVFESTDLAGKNLFTVNADTIEARLESNPSIADAQVYVSWPPNAVSVVVAERDPVLIWEQGDFRVWVDVNGIVMFQREERDDLIRIVHVGEDEEPLGVGNTIDRDIVAGALQLHAKLPSIKVFFFDPVNGLGYFDERNWRAWFGVGTDMQRRLDVYDQIVRMNYPNVQFAEIDVSNADYPVYEVRYATE
jgi:hypothetical protein